MEQSSILKVIISGGGTGGHIFPALSIADEIRKRDPNADILFVGAEGRMEMQKVPQAGYPIEGLPVRGLDRKKLWRNFAVLKSLIKSRLLARDILEKFEPQVVIGVGGYASAPVLKEAQKKGIPTLIQEQNSYAGVTNKLLAQKAQAICTAYPNMERFFPADKITLTGNPIRPAIENIGSVSEKEALDYFGFSTHNPHTILVTGGSLGARSINQGTSQSLQRWKEKGFRLIWQTGKAYFSTAESQLKELGYEDSYLTPFIDRMDFAFLLASLVVSRAGASSISEFCFLGKPTVLIPSPNVAEDHQTKNAQVLSQRGAAILLLDAKATTDLAPIVEHLVTDENRLHEMAKEVKELALPNAVVKIVDIVFQMIGKEK